MPPALSLLSSAGWWFVTGPGGARRGERQHWFPLWAGVCGAPSLPSSGRPGPVTWLQADSSRGAVADSLMRVVPRLTWPGASLLRQVTNKSLPPCFWGRLSPPASATGSAVHLAHRHLAVASFLHTIVLLSPAAPSGPFRTVGRSEVTHSSQCPKPETPSQIRHLDPAGYGRSWAVFLPTSVPTPRTLPPAIHGRAPGVWTDAHPLLSHPPPARSPCTDFCLWKWGNHAMLGEQCLGPPSPRASPWPRAQAPRESAGAGVMPAGRASRFQGGGEFAPRSRAGFFLHTLFR